MYSVTFDRLTAGMGWYTQIIFFVCVFTRFEGFCIEWNQKKNWYFFGRKLWSGLIPPSQLPPPPKSTIFFDAAPQITLLTLTQNPDQDSFHKSKSLDGLGRLPTTHLSRTLSYQIPPFIWKLLYQFEYCFQTQRKYNVHSVYCFIVELLL